MWEIASYRYAMSIPQPCYTDLVESRKFLRPRFPRLHPSTLYVPRSFNTFEDGKRFNWHADENPAGEQRVRKGTRWIEEASKLDKRKFYAEGGKGRESRARAEKCPVANRCDYAYIYGRHISNEMENAWLRRERGIRETRANRSLPEEGEGEGERHFQKLPQIT